MILRRMADAIKRQDWFQVTVEILIVVIGIFLGLQVTDWAERQNDLETEKRIVDYLIADTENSIEYLITSDLFYENELNSAYRVLELLGEDELKAEDVADFEEGLYFIGKTTPLVPYLNSFNEQNLNNIQDIELRRIIDDYVGWKNSAQALTDRTLEKINNVMAYIMTKSSVGDDYGTKSVKNYQFDRLKDEYEYRVAFTTVFDRVHGSQNLSNTLLENSKILLGVLKQFKAGENIVQVTFQAEMSADFQIRNPGLDQGTEAGMTTGENQ